MIEGPASPGGALEAWGNAPRSPSRRPQSATAARPVPAAAPVAPTPRWPGRPQSASARPQSASPRSRPQSARPHRPPVIVDGEHVWVKTSSPLHDATAPLLRIEGAALAAASPREQTLEGRLSASQQRADALDAKVRTLEARNRVLLRRTLSPPPRASPPPERSPPPAPRLNEFRIADDGAHRPAGESRTSKVGMSGVARVHSAGFPRRGGLASKSSHQYARAKAAALAGGYRPPSPPQPRLPPREAAVSPPPVAAAADADAADDAAAGEAASAQEMLEAVLRHLERHGHTEAAAGVRSAFSHRPPAAPKEGARLEVRPPSPRLEAPVVAVDSS